MLLIRGEEARQIRMRLDLSVRYLRERGIGTHRLTKKRTKRQELKTKLPKLLHNLLQRPRLGGGTGQGDAPIRKGELPRGALIKWARR